MQVFKPLQASLLYKTFEWEGRQRFAVSQLLGFSFEKEEALLEQDVWSFVPAEVGGILDLCMPKPNGEALVYGSYYSPGGVPVTEGGVRLKIGPIDKKLLVVGNRYWRALVGPSKPEPFREMRLDYEHAFGGPGFAKNPTGKGIVDVDVGGEMRRPLPNIEDPAKVMASSGDRPDPAGLAALDVAWEDRASRMGTYDQQWIEERAPEYPLDLDWNHFNTAPPDQWLEEFFGGDEEFELVNMHPEKKVLKGRLPGFRARCFIEKRREEDTRFEEVGMRAETVWFFPHLEKGIVLYRGVADIATDDASDVSYLLAAYENMADAPRDGSHYAQALKNRLDPARSYLYMLNTADLIPDGATCGYAATSGVDIAHEEEVARNQEAEAEALKAETAAALESEKSRIEELFKGLGIDPKPFVAKFDGEPGEKRAPMGASDATGELDELSDKPELSEEDIERAEALLLSAEDIAAEKDKAAKTLLSMLSAHLERHEGNESLKQQVRATLESMCAPPELPRPPSSEVGRMLYLHAPDDEVAYSVVEYGDAETAAQLTAEGAEGLILTLTESGEELREGYREQAHLLDRGVPPRKAAAGRVQEALLDLLRTKQRVAGGDFCGIDLSGQDLSGADLRGCFLEGVDLSNAHLTGANLEGAILAFSNLSGCDLSEAKMKGANLGAGNLNGACFQKADMREVILAGSQLSGARLTGCDLTDADFSDANLSGADFSGATLPGAAFSELDMAGVKFRNAVLPGSEFINCKLGGSDFSGATLDESSWIESTLDQGDFTEAKMTNTRFPGGTSLRGARFVRAVLNTANLRETELEGADFTEADLTMADFGDAKAEKSIFTKSVAKYAQFIGADLGSADLSGMNMMEGSLLKARLTSANLSDANCYGVEFMKATVGDTQFGRTLLDMTKLAKWRPGR